MSIGTVSRFVLSHKRLVVGFWLIVTIIAAASVGSATGALSDDFSLPDSESAGANRAIEETYGNGGNGYTLVPVITLPTGTTVDSPGVRGQLQAAFDEVAAAAPETRVVSYASTGNRMFVSEDGSTTYGLVSVPPEDAYRAPPQVPIIEAAFADIGIAEAQVRVTGIGELTGGEGQAEGTAVLVEVLVGGLGALLVLIWVFGSFLALVPLFVAAVAILTSFLLLWGLASVTAVGTETQFLIALIGLGIAIDYSLLIITRWREERAAGHENRVAVQRSMETAGHAVLFSGLTVAVGLCALIIVPIPFLQSMGYGGLLIPLVSVLVAITLLPVLLATIGPRVDWPRRRQGNQSGPFWERWAQLVVRRRGVAAFVGLALLGALLVPAFQLQIGEAGADSLATSGPAYEGFQALERAGIGEGVLTPFDVLVEGTDPTAVAAALAEVDGLQGAVAPEGEAWRRDGTAIVVAVPEANGNLPAGRDALTAIREVTAGLPGTIMIGGSAAWTADFIDAVYGNFPLALALILLVTFVVLVRAFRSLLLPLKAVILNVISVGAAFGALVLIWQMGYGSELIWGIAPSEAITSWVPLILFAFLFGLSMDYEVFILARMREEYDATGSTDTAIVRGIGQTARLVTSAALILFLAFVAMASGPETEIKIIATGAAVGILLDATIVRALLVPATVSLMGKWNWWLPGWLNRFVPAPQQKGIDHSVAAIGSEAD